MNRNEMIRELLTVNRKALQFCHTALGMDFEQDFYISCGEGSFTFKRVTDGIEAEIGAGFEGVVLMEAPRPSAWQSLYVVEIGANRFCTKRATSWPYGFGVDDFYSVGAFEELRKRGRGYYWVIAQRRELVGELRDQREMYGVPEQSRRYRLTDKPGRELDTKSGKTFLSKFTLSPIDEKNAAFRWCPERAAIGDPAAIESYIDKSGYPVALRREELARRAEKLRAERAQAAAQSADFSAPEQEIERLKRAASAAIASMASAASTEADYRALERAATRMASIQWSAKRYAQRREAGKFSSVAAREAELDAIREKLTALVADIEPQKTAA